MAAPFGIGAWPVMEALPDNEYDLCLSGRVAVVFQQVWQ